MKTTLRTDISQLPFCFYLLVLSQVNDRVLRQMKKVKKSKDISGSGICEWGGTLADSETAYNYQIAYNRYFAGVSDTVQSVYLYGAEVGGDTYDEKLGVITAEGIFFRSSQGNIYEGQDALKGLWTFPYRISSTFITYGHQVCKNADGDSFTEVCVRKHVYHKVEPEEHAIDVDNFSFCIISTEVCNMKIFWVIVPNIV